MGFTNMIKRLLPDKLYLKLRFKRNMGYNLDLKNPSTFNEKLQWLKLYDRNPLYSQLVDKYEVKEYVKRIIGDEFIIPTIGVWNNFNEIPFNDLPEKFVLKCTHDSGGIVICKDIHTFDIEKAKEKINNSMNNNFFWESREWPYKYIKPRIIAERYIEDDNDKELRDYKFYCFNGIPYYMLLATGRMSQNEELCFDYYDMDFNHLNLTNHWHPNSKKELKKPDKFESMINISKVLSDPFPQVRVDLYEANGQVYFGELTFFDMGGFLKIHPDDWDKEWGSHITLKNT